MKKHSWVDTFMEKEYEVYHSVWKITEHNNSFQKTHLNLGNILNFLAKLKAPINFQASEKNDLHREEVIKRRNSIKLGRKDSLSEFDDYRLRKKT